MRKQARVTSQAVPVQEVSRNCQQDCLGTKVWAEDSLAECLGGIVAEPAIGPGTVSCRQEVLAYDVALLLANRRGWPEGWTHRLPN